MARTKIVILVSSLTICTAVVLDRISKVFFSHLLSVGESIPVVRNVVHATLVHNTGIAFGLFKDKGFLFIIIAIIAIALFIVHLYLHRNNKHFGKIYVFAFSLIIGGAIGNLIDRIHYGFVIDFIDFRIWPVFNLADSAITVGTIIIILKCIPSFSK